MNRNSLLVVALLAIAVLALSGCSIKGNGNADANAQIPFPQNPTAPDTNVNPAQPTAEQLAREAELKLIAQITPQVEVCSGKLTPLERDTCLLGLAKSAKTDFPCGKITFLSMDRCYGETAAITLNVQSCEKISNIFLKNQCIDVVATGKKDAEICLKISDQLLRDGCVKEIAEPNNSAKQCEFIFDSTKRNDCYINVAGAIADDSFCGQIGIRQDSRGFERDRCYYAAHDPLAGDKCPLLLGDALRRRCFLDAANDADANVECSSITDTESKNNCNFWVGTSTLQISFCGQLPFAQSKECVAKILAGSPAAEQCKLVTDLNAVNGCYHKAAIDGNSEAPCTQIVGDSHLKDTCFLDVAILQSNRNVCKNIRLNNFSGRDGCFSIVALQNSDYATCEYVTADKGYYLCFSVVAEKLGAPEICEKARKEQLKTLPYLPSQYCYREYAIANQNAFACAQITVPTVRNDCYSKVAILANDTGLCVNISDLNARAQCRKLEPVECIEDWFCGNWGICNEGKSRRNCFDENNCGTREGEPDYVKTC